MGFTHLKTRLELFWSEGSHIMRATKIDTFGGQKNVFLIFIGRVESGGWRL
jgi:hypothetical protein